MTYPTITKTFDYPRPYFEMPNPKSTQGNPIEYFSLALECLKKSGFSKEYDEMMHYGKAVHISSDKIIFHIPYQEQMDFLSHFLEIDTTSYLQEENLENALADSTEDNENFYYIKKRRNTIFQNKNFKLKQPQEIQKLIDNQHDFSIMNNYNRLHIHYLKNYQSIELLLKENEKHQWFDIFHLDVFNSTLLHGQNMQVFDLILNHMYTQNKSLTYNFLFGINVFNENALSYFLKSFDDFISLFPKYKNIETFEEQQKENLKNFSNIIQIIYHLDINFYNKFINQFDVLNSKDQYNNFREFILVNLLNNNLSENQKNPIKKVKI